MSNQHTPDEAAINALREAVLLGFIKPTADQQTILRLSVQRDELLALLSRLVPLLELDDEHAVTGIFSSQTRGAIEEARAFITKPAFDPSALPDDDPPRAGR